MARAKRTDRAEARRRYRAQLAAESGEELDPAEDGEPATEPRAPSRTSPRGASAATSAAPPQRPGIGNAFRAAFRSANFREDLAALPRLVRHRSIWLPALISIGTTAVFLTTGGSDAISLILAQYFIAPPPIGGIFLAGFLAPRASYLTGGIAGLVGAICFAILVTTSASGAVGTPTASSTPSALASPGASPSPAVSASAAASPAPSVSPPPSAAGSPQASPTPSGTGTPMTPEERASTIAAAFLLSPLTGAFFGAAAAWYRRFLNLANPNRGVRRPPPNRGKPVRRR